MKSALKKACRMRSNIPPPAPGEQFSRRCCVNGKIAQYSGSIKLSLDGVTHLFPGIRNFREGIGVRFLCRIYGAVL